MSSKPSQKYAQQELVAGRYMTSHVIGKGGMGKVVYGKHVDLQQEVAIKYLRTTSRSGGESASKRFCQEALTYASINHPNIVKLLDFERTKHGELRMVLEYVKGETLGTFLRRTGQCHPMFAIDVIIQIAQGLSAAHAKSIIHRDLKPDNIMLSPLTKSRRHYHVKLLDFGIAKNLHHEGERYTAAGTVCGTPDYMSPEQARGLDIDTRSDIYSLGVLLFEMLAGRLPYVATGKQKVMTAHCWTPIPLTSDFSSYPIPTVLEDLVQCCLAKNAADRFQSVEELIKALEVVAEREYDQVSPTKFNALTPTGERIRFNQHPARDLDRLQQASSVDLPVTPSIAELDQIRDEAFSISEHQVSKVGGSARSHHHQIPISVLVNDISTQRPQVEEPTAAQLEEIKAAQEEAKAAEPQVSARDFHINGLERMSLSTWGKSIWRDFIDYAEGSSPKVLMGSIGFTLLVVFAISISLQQPTPYPSSSYSRAEFVQNTKIESQPTTEQQATTDKMVTLAETSIRSGLSPEKEQGAEALKQLALIGHEKELEDKLYRKALSKFEKGELQAVIDLLSPYANKAKFNSLLNNVELLRSFIKRAESTPCSRFIEDEKEEIHIEIVNHPIVVNRIEHCKKVLPPDTL